MAKLRFAHAETLLPFSCLIGLFLDGRGEMITVYPFYQLLVACSLGLTFILFWVFRL